MEYLSLKGSIKLAITNDAIAVNQTVLKAVQAVEFHRESAAIRTFIVDDYLHIRGEGTLDEVQSNRLIDGLVKLSKKHGPDFFVEICRMRWELYITLGYRVEVANTANAVQAQALPA